MKTRERRKKNGKQKVRLPNQSSMKYTRKPFRYCTFQFEQQHLNQ